MTIANFEEKDNLKFLKYQHKSKPVLSYLLTLPAKNLTNWEKLSKAKSKCQQFLKNQKHIPAICKDLKIESNWYYKNADFYAFYERNTEKQLNFMIATII